MKNIFKALPLFAAMLAGMAGCQEKDVPVIPQNPTYPEREANTMVIYEANPKLFGTSNTLNGIKSRLDEIKQLGVNVLWIMPIHPEGELWGTGSPYCVKDYKAVNPECGTMADLKSLVSEAHAKDMKVIMDWIANHTAWDHEWVKKHPDWYTKDSDGDIIWPGDWKDVADLAFEIEVDGETKKNEAMRKEMIDAMKYWISEADIDGFRFDYVDGVPADFWTEAIAALHSQKEGIITIAESSDASVMSCGFDMLYGWDYKAALSKTFTGGNVTDLYSANTAEYSGLKPGMNRMRFITNHDQMSEKGISEEFSSPQGALAAFVATTYMGGVPMIYSSQETGYSEKVNFFENHEIDWNIDPGFTENYKMIMQAYHETAPLRKGEPQMYYTGKVISISYNDELYIAVNSDKSAVTFNIPSTMTGCNYTELVRNTNGTLSQTETIEAYGYRIWKIEK